jgi:sugar/nucleoside kinase (ribokinase family)
MIDVLVVGGVFVEVLEADRQGRPRFGGSGLCAAMAAAAFEASTALAGAVGENDDRAVRSLLEASGIDHRALVAASGSSGTFIFAHAQDPAHPWPLYRPAEGTPDVVPELPNARVVLAFGIPDFDPLASGWLASLQPEFLIWDRQGWLSRAHDNSRAARVTAGSRIYVANAQEALADLGATEKPDPPKGFNAALVKDGARGVRLIQQRQEGRFELRIQAFHVEAESTVGSGDVFAGALAASLARDADLVEAIRVGCAAASVSLSRRHNLLTREDADEARRLLATRSS